MRILILFSFFISSFAFSQSFRPSIEVYAGANAYHVAKNHEFSYYPKGVTGIMGAKATYHFGNYIAINAGGGFRTSPWGANYFGMTTLRITFLRRFETGFSAFVESGLEVAEYTDAFIPLYIGTNQYFGKGVSLNFRLRIPSIVDVEPLAWSNRYELGVEFGLQFDIRRNRPPKQLTKFGNPFILGQK